MDKLIKYFITGILFWVIVDFTTTEAIMHPMKYYLTFMPNLLVFYIGYPLIFSLLIYRYKISDKLLFIATLVSACIIEIVLSHNALLYTFPMMLITIPVAIVIYRVLTFMPKWIVDRTIAKHTWEVLLMMIVWIFVSLATLLGNRSA